MEGASGRGVDFAGVRWRPGMDDRGEMDTVWGAEHVVR
jgi:hypothetical protein